MVINKRSVLFVGIILVIGSILRCWNINQSFWWDEIWSTMTFVKADSLWEVMSSLGYYFNNHIFYSLMARISCAVLGTTEFASRFPALLMGLLGIVALFFFGKTYLGIGCAVLAVFLLAIAPFHIDHSTEARGYSGLALFSLLSSFYFLRGLKADKLKSWFLYIVFTVLGFYSHVFMIAVALSQFISSAVIMLGQKGKVCKWGVGARAFKRFLCALFCSAAITLVLYSPVLSTFVHNMGKVRLVAVNRFPFILKLASALLPGVESVSGALIYLVLFCAGLRGIFKEDSMLFVYVLTLLLVPLSLYLGFNPMFVFERYFIFFLPFALLIIAKGTVDLAGRLGGIFEKGIIVAVLAVLVVLQLPAIATTLRQDRQNYREAVHYVEREEGKENDTLVFSIGYAGEHFRYYSSRGDIATPETLNELTELTRGKRYVWCLITAWLPEICPPYEDKELYAERSGQVDIFNYVKTNFEQIKKFSSRYPVEIHFWER